MSEFYFLDIKEQRNLFSKYEKEIEKLIGKSVLIKSERDNYQVELSSGKIIAGWMLKEMPGCCGICVATGAFVMDDFRNKGIGTILNSLRIALATELKFGLLLCTDVLENEPQQKILTNNCWTKINEFLNPKTENTIGIHCIKLNTEK